jgi:cytochrome bd-type quinol oxidase subunit 2
MFMMKLLSVRYAVYAQLCFYGGLIVCVILKAQGLSANGGISYYGDHRTTILPYIFALLGAAYFTIRVAEQLVSPELAVAKHILTAIGLLTIGIMVTPDALSKFMDDLHRACGTILFTLQLLLSCWIIGRLKGHRVWPFLLTAMELFGGIMSFIYLAPPKGFLIESQVVFQLGFGCLLIYTLPYLQKDATASLRPKS